MLTQSDTAFYQSCRTMVKVSSKKSSNHPTSNSLPCRTLDRTRWACTSQYPRTSRNVPARLVPLIPVRHAPGLSKHTSDRIIQDGHHSSGLHPAQFLPVLRRRLLQHDVYILGLGVSHIHREEWCALQISNRLLWCLLPVR